MSNKVHNKFERLGGCCSKSLLSSLANGPTTKKNDQSSQQEGCNFLEVRLKMQDIAYLAKRETYLQRRDIYLQSRDTYLHIRTQICSQGALFEHV